jgi:hypothetical protein
VIRLAVAAAALVLALPASAALAPTLQVRELAPFTVHGSHFAGGERVRVTLGRAHVIAHATAIGTFTTVFAGVDVNRCDGYLVTAVGADGSRASASARPLACPSTNPG